MNEINTKKMGDLKPGDVIHAQGISCKIAENTKKKMVEYITRVMETITEIICIGVTRIKENSGITNDRYPHA